MAMSEEPRNAGAERGDADRYLWERSGPPDPEVARLEQVLSSLRYRGALPELAERAPQHVARRRLWPLAAAAAILLAGSVTWLLVRGDAVPVGWDVQAQAGLFLIDADPPLANARLGIGQWLHTPPGASARVSVGEIGTLTVHPNSRVLLLACGPASQRMRLAEGTIEAMITAPPRLFVVDTPAAAAVDYGCAYTLVVDAAGNGVLAVTMGFVALERDGRKVLVPSRAICRMRPGLGPGTPFYTDATEALKQAIDAVDFDGADRGAALDSVLREARRDDAITLWHLMLRLQGGEAQAAYDRLAALAPPPPGVTRAGILARDQTMLRAWSEELDVFW
jgi:ferric-dicitrate binding protein FerR (iron transport regulator)